MRYLLTMFAIGLYSLPINAQVRPTLFVTPEQSMAWWAAQLDLRPRSVQVAGVTLEQVNTLLNSKRGMRSEKDVCFLDPLTETGIVSVDRPTQQDIDTTLKENPDSFRSTFMSSRGEKFDIRVVAYEMCGSDLETGTALLITDSLGALSSFDRQDFLFTRLNKQADGQIKVFGCFACGDVSELRYDESARRFYYEWVGH